MNNATNKVANAWKDMRVRLSTLWIFAVLNYIYADVFTQFFSSEAQNTATTMSSGTILAFAILMETSIAMVLLSRFVNYGANRWLNVAIGILHTGAVAWSLFQGTPEPFYLMFASIEILCTLFIIINALRWRKQEP